MKKIMVSLLLVVMLFSFNANVFATETKVSCGLYTQQECNSSKDAAGNQCYVGNNGNCFAKENTSNGTLDDSENTNTNNNTNNNYNNFNSSDIVCGNGVTISTTVINIAYYVVLVFQVAAPIIIVVFGMFDLAKSIMSGKDDEIKKGQSTFFKRLFAGVMVFLVITITKLVLNVFASNGIVECVNCFFNGASSCR